MPVSVTELPLHKVELAAVLIIVGVLAVLQETKTVFDTWPTCMLPVVKAKQATVYMPQAVNVIETAEPFGAALATMA